MYDLCLSLFPWADFRQQKRALKLHTSLNLRAAIPRFLHVTEGKVHDVNEQDILTLAGGIIFQMDQTTFADSDVLRAFGECRLHPNLDCGVY